jgi:hypothetical protein
MDIFFNELTLFVIAIMAVTAFFLYSISVIRRDGPVAYFAKFARMMKLIGSILVSFVGALVGLLATNANTSEREDDDTDGDLTGDYNFRTRKYDNGTDPYGWYEEDL